MMSKKRTGRVAGAVVLLLLLAMLYSAVQDCWMDYWLNRDGKTMTAVIRAEKSHGVLEYQYSISGVGHEGNGQRGRTLPADARVGDEVRIWISSSHPWMSSPQLPTGMRWRQVISIGVLTCVGIFVVKGLIDSNC